MPTEHVTSTTGSGPRLIAPIASSQNPDLANAFVKYTVSPAGQKTLQSYGFLPPPLR